MASQAERNLRIVNSKGLHARAAAKLAKLVDEFDAVIVISKASMEVPGNSIMGLMMLGALAQGAVVASSALSIRAGASDGLR